MNEQTSPQMKQVSGTVKSMTRLPDHATSIAAAEKVSGKKLTIREQVIRFALTKPYGFIDGDLLDAFPGWPESSARKRRTELADENLLISDGTTRDNAHGQPSLVWFHRDFVTNPPPIRQRQKKPSRLDGIKEENALLRAQAEAVREAEQARVVEWLRKNNWMAAGTAADYIAAGEHRR